jgi:hypothetical protein
MLATAVNVNGGAIDTVAVCEAEPPAPEHVSVKLPSADSAPELCEPDVACVPVQLPDAVQLVASVELHVSVEEPPEAIMVGDADSVTVGTGAIDTVAVCEAEPPTPEHVSVKLPSADSAPELCEPVVASVPVQLPDAVQLVAFVELHVSVEEPPEAILVGDADSVTVGTGAIDTVAVCEAEPPAPAHVSVKLLSADSAPELCEPDVPSEPVQLPDAVQVVAFVELHVSVEEPPEAILVGDADSVTVGTAEIGAPPLLPLPPPPQAAS